MQQATIFQLLGAGAFGFMIGWFLFYLNRHRTDAVRFQDLISLIGALGGASVLALFPAETDLFAAYGIGLLAGFLGYFLVLSALVWRSENFDMDYFIDGRHRKPRKNQVAAPTKVHGAMQATADEDSVRE